MCELARGLHEGFGIELSPDDLEALREVLDLDKDGAVSVQEWTAAVGLLDERFEAEVWGRIVRMLRADFRTSYELFAFFEKEEGQVSSTTSTLGRKSDTSRNRKLSLRSSLATSEVTSKKKETHNPDKGVSPTHEVSLRSRITKKNEKIMKRAKEVEEDKLVHR